MWEWPTPVPDGQWLVRVFVNDHLAYFNSHTLDPVLF
jgi:hypothetical protein